MVNILSVPVRKISEYFPGEEVLIVKKIKEGRFLAALHLPLLQHRTQVPRLPSSPTNQDKS